MGSYIISLAGRWMLNKPPVSRDAYDQLHSQKHRQRDVKHATRRIKCDETRPFCSRCTSTGRKCDGYATKAAIAHPTPSSQDEFQAVQSFRERTLAQVSEFFIDELWTTKILRIAHAEPGIWHALISLSSYHDLFMHPVDAANGQLAVERHNLGIYALHHHNMAIKAALDIQRTPKHPLSHIISCVVFVIIEIIRGEIIAAIRLLKYGQRVLQEFETQQRHSQMPLGPEDGVIVSLVGAFFTGLTHQAVCVGYLTGVTIY
ncbi:hypothetical protein J3458_019703 [Metarhizium acridum]|uniref:uncharacterized protein n=1 Tax=Metarhizium acridum TaxID=92637 RepID=UPI001C6AB256|nr:hypothetical protein J3458_019703 [Metarhizium acridum]